MLAPPPAGASRTSARMGLGRGGLGGSRQEHQEVPSGDAEDRDDADDERPARLPDPEAGHHREEQQPHEEAKDQRQAVDRRPRLVDAPLTPDQGDAEFHPDYSDNDAQ